MAANSVGRDVPKLTVTVEVRGQSVQNEYSRVVQVCLSDPR